MDIKSFFRNSCNCLKFTHFYIEDGGKKANAELIVGFMVLIASKNDSLPNKIGINELKVKGLTLFNQFPKTVFNKIFTKVTIDKVIPNNHCSIPIQHLENKVFYRFVDKNIDYCGVNMVNFIEKYGHILASIDKNIENQSDKPVFSMDGRGGFDALNPLTAFKSLERLKNSGDDLNELLLNGLKLKLDLNNPSELKRSLFFINLLQSTKSRFNLFKYYTSKFSFAGSFVAILESSEEYYRELSKRKRMFKLGNRTYDSIVNILCQHIISEESWVKGVTISKTPSIINLPDFLILKKVIENGTWYSLNLPSRSTIEELAQDVRFAGKNVPINIAFIELIKKANPELKAN